MPAATSSSIVMGQTATTSTAGSSETLSVQVATGAVGADTSSGTVVSVAGDATALGTNTYAGATVIATASDGSAYATATFVAAATGSGSFAATSATISAAGDASRGISISSVETTASWSDDWADASSVSFVELQMVDPYAPLDNFSGYAPAEEPLPDYTDCGCDGSGGGGGIFIDGNLAIFAVDASAYGDNTFVDTMVTAFTLEDALSTVSAVVVVAVG